MLHDLFCKFDTVCNHHELYKVETIGDVRARAALSHPAPATPLAPPSFRRSHLGISSHSLLQLCAPCWSYTHPTWCPTDAMGDSLSP
jgi:hypothetical protein